MRVKVKSTGEIITLGPPRCSRIDPDYWTRLEHQYAGMAMQGLISSKRGLNIETDMYDIPYYSKMLAHALVEKLKESK